MVKKITEVSRDPWAGNFCRKTASGIFFAAGEPPAPSRAGRKKASSNHFELEVAGPLVLGDIRYHRYRTIYPICMSSLSKGDLLPCSSGFVEVRLEP